MTYTDLYNGLINYHITSSQHETAKKELTKRFIQVNNYAPHKDVYTGALSLRAWARQMADKEATK